MARKRRKTSRRSRRLDVIPGFALGTEPGRLLATGMQPANAGGALGPPARRAWGPLILKLLALATAGGGVWWVIRKFIVKDGATSGLAGEWIREGMPEQCPRGLTLRYRNRGGRKVAMCE